MMLDILEWDAQKNDYVPVKKPKLQPACQMAITEGMDVKSDTSEPVEDARARRCRSSCSLNHPVDCPICDQAGECEAPGLLAPSIRRRRRSATRSRSTSPRGVVFGPTIVYATPSAA